MFESFPSHHRSALRVAFIGAPILLSSSDSVSPPTPEETTGTGLLSSCRHLPDLLVFGAVWISAMWGAAPTGTWSEWAFLVIAALLLYVLIRASTARSGNRRPGTAPWWSRQGASSSPWIRRERSRSSNRYAEQIFGIPPQRGPRCECHRYHRPGERGVPGGPGPDDAAAPLHTGTFLKNRNENVTADGKRITVLWTNRRSRIRMALVRCSPWVRSPRMSPLPLRNPRLAEDDDSIFF